MNMRSRKVKEQKQSLERKVRARIYGKVEYTRNLKAFYLFSLGLQEVTTLCICAMHMCVCVCAILFDALKVTIEKVCTEDMLRKQRLKSLFLFSIVLNF